MDLAIWTDVLPAGAVLRVVGELDLTTSPKLARHLEELAVDFGNPLVVDLSGVTFIDSSGLSCLVTARRVVASAEGRLALVASDRTLQLLRLTNMDSVFHLYDSVQLALDDFAQVG